MSDQVSPLPPRPSLEQLRKQAKERLVALRASSAGAKLAEAQFLVARSYGFSSWPKLVDHVSATDPQAAAPRITAPVSRFLGTKDIDRTVRFWRDVLGFEVHQPPDDGTAVLQSGRARIRFGKDDCEATAVIFFDTDDVEGMRSLIQQRGGEPGGLEKVNWIKRRVFEVRDPDGHVIWFGQSYHMKSPERPRSMMSRVMPELPFDDVPAAVMHYRDVLGFVVNYQQNDIGVLDRDEVRVLLVRRTPRHTGIGSAYFYVRDVDALHAELVRSGADTQAEPISQPWGLREFSILDPERNRLTFGQTFE